jgi:hypothetical protein
VFTLDAAATLFDGFSITVLSLTGPIAFNPNASDNFFGQSGGEAFSVPQGCCATIETNGASSGLWVANVTPAAVTKAIQQAATSALNFVTPLNQQDHPSAAKAWVFALNTTAIQSSYGVSSVTRTGVGSYVVHFSVPFASSPSCMAIAIDSNISVVSIIATIGLTSVTVVFRNSTTGNVVDPAGGLTVQCFGPQ